jgi:hypothetical protein
MYSGHGHKSEHGQGCEHYGIPWGLLNRSMARYFYKRLRTSLNKLTGNLLVNLFSKKCAFKKNLQLLEKKFSSQSNTTTKNGLLLIKMARLLKSSIFQ